MSFSNDFIDRLKNQVLISSVIGQHVSWDIKRSKPSSGDYWGCCPFHKEKTPSFHVNDNKGSFYCFGCHEKGSAIDFIMKTKNLNFSEAVENIADTAGIPIQKKHVQSQEQHSDTQAIYAALVLAVAYYRAQLTAPHGKEAREYLNSRGVSDSSITTFELGFAGVSANALVRHLVSKGVSTKTCLQAGLCVSVDRNKVDKKPTISELKDRFINRIMFPILDRRGRCVGFGGRALRDGKWAKYINSPETSVFHKGRLLYNHNHAQSVPDEPCFVVEGYLDAILLSQYGFCRVVAPLGTAVTSEHVAMLLRARNIIIVFDGDESGQRAAIKAAYLSLAHMIPGVTVRFVNLPAGYDPDSFVRENGAGAFDELVKSATMLVDMLWQDTLSSIGDSHAPENLADLDVKLRKLTSTIQDNDVQRHYKNAFAHRKANRFKANRFSGASGFQDYKEHNHSPNSRTRGLWQLKSDSSMLLKTHEATILLTFLRYPMLLNTLGDRFMELQFSSEEYEKVCSSMMFAISDCQQDSVSSETFVEMVTESLGYDPIAYLEGVPGVSVHRFALGQSSLQAVEAGLGEALNLHAWRTMVEKEKKEAQTTLQGTGGDAEASRISDERLRGMYHSQLPLQKVLLSQTRTEEQDDFSELSLLVQDKIWEK
jgi:DNA primase